MCVQVRGRAAPTREARVALRIRARGRHRRLAGLWCLCRGSRRDEPPQRCSALLPPPAELLSDRLRSAGGRVGEEFEKTGRGVQWVPAGDGLRLDCSKCVPRPRGRRQGRCHGRRQPRFPLLLRRSGGSSRRRRRGETARRPLGTLPPRAPHPHTTPTTHSQPRRPAPTPTT